MTETQTERIQRMEGYLDETEAALDELSRALKRYEAVCEHAAALERYYESPRWQEDFEADEAGKLPQTLKRGVLSEDAVYNLLNERDRILHEACSYLQSERTANEVCRN